MGRLERNWQKGVRECDSQTQEAGEQGCSSFLGTVRVVRH